MRWGEVFPLLEAKQRLLPLRRVPIKALLRAELLVRKSVPDKTEKAFAYLATRLSLRRCIPSHLTRHGRTSHRT